MFTLVIASLLMAQQTPPVAPASTNPNPSLEFIKAAEQADLEKLRSLGAYVDVAWAGDDSRTALVVAGHKGNRAVFAEIIAIANSNLTKQVSRLPKEGQPAVAPSLLALQARIDIFNRPDTNGTTPLMLAATHGWDDLARALVDGGAKADSRDTNGSSASDYARAAGLIALAEFLDKAATTIP